MVLFLLTAVVLTLLVLIQRGRGGGLAGAFGGAGGSSAFGTKTADVFVRATAVVGAIFFLLSVVTAILLSPAKEKTPREPPAVPAPAEPGTGAATPAEKAEKAPEKAAPTPAEKAAGTPAEKAAGGTAAPAPAETPKTTPAK
jgi:preprotein translocase subunit SecG